MNPPVFLTLAELLEIHHMMIDLYGGDTGIRSQGMLESALAMPESGFGDELFHPTLFSMAAAYAFHIAQNQPFVDGNKRTGIAAGLAFLELNGVTVPDPKGRLYEAMIAIAEKKMTKADLAALLETLAKKPRSRRSR